MSKKHPLVSIAIITYNQKEFLRECIDSILIQDYSNFEIVVADDCSSDGTQELLKTYKNKHPNKFVLELAKKNLGITQNSNKAHFASKGVFLPRKKTYAPLLCKYTSVTHKEALVSPVIKK